MAASFCHFWEPEEIVKPQSGHIIGFVLHVILIVAHWRVKNRVKGKQSEKIKSGLSLTLAPINWDANTVLNRFCNPSFKLSL